MPNMQEALKGAKVLYRPFTPVKGMNVAFIEEEGIPIELDYFYLCFPMFFFLKKGGNIKALSIVGKFCFSPIVRESSL